MPRAGDEDKLDDRKRNLIIGVVTLLLSGIIFAGITIKIFGFQKSPFGYFVVTLLGVCSCGLLVGLTYCCYQLRRSEAQGAAASRLSRSGNTGPLNQQDYLDDACPRADTDTVTYTAQYDAHAAPLSEASSRGCSGVTCSYVQVTDTHRPDAAASDGVGPLHANCHSAAAAKGFKGRAAASRTSPPSYYTAMQREGAEGPRHQGAVTPARYATRSRTDRAEAQWPIRNENPWHPQKNGCRLTENHMEFTV